MEIGVAGLQSPLRHAGTAQASCCSFLASYSLTSLCYFLHFFVLPPMAPYPPAMP